MRRKAHLLRAVSLFLRYYKMNVSHTCRKVIKEIRYGFISLFHNNFVELILNMF